MLSETGNILLIVSCLIAVYAIVCSIIGLKKNRSDLKDSGTRGVIAIFVLITLISVVLFTLLIKKDFSNAYVANYTSKTLPFFYTLSAFWAGQDGSLLLWLWALSIFSFVVVLPKDTQRERLPAAIVLLFVELFFLCLILFLNNPFRRIAVIPALGNGMNPLLQNIYMVSHPPMIFIGYAAFTIPFAFALSSLFTKRQNTQWIKQSRFWLLFAWFFLGFGILLGAKWAYIVLGWGGYWGWDPVENASLIPWIVATALLHSIVMEERKGTLRIWNLVLMFLVFELCVFGTFITRTNILSSVHSFVESNIGIYLFAFILVSSVVYLTLLLLRCKALSGKSQPLSIKEWFFFLNNIVLVAVGFIILFGTLFPLVSGFFGKTRISLGPAFYTQALTPLALLLLLLTGLCSTLQWGRQSTRRLLYHIVPACFVSLVIVTMLILRGERHAAPIIAFALSSFIIVTVALEIKNIKRFFLNRRKLGGYIVHSGIALMCIGITGSSIYNSERQVILKKGESEEFGKYSLYFRDLKEDEDERRYKLSVLLDIRERDITIRTLAPAKLLYPNSEEPYTEIAVLSSWREDLYIIFAGLVNKDTVSLKALRKPFIRWLWVGGYLFLLGSIIAMFPQARGKEKLTIDDRIEELVKIKRKSKNGKGKEQ